MPKRVIVVAMCFVAMVICYLDRVSMSTAVVPMAEQYGWSNTTKGWVLSSFFIGYMLTQIPASWVVNRYGGRIVLGISLVWWSLVTMVTPLAAMSSLGLLIVVRVAMGVGEAAVTPSLYNLAARWLPPHERARSIAVMIGGIPMGTLAALLLSGWLLEHHPWPVMFYVFGAAGIVFAIFWFRMIYASPARHPHMSASERSLLTGPDVVSSEARKGSWSEVPWRKLLSTPAVWALISNHFCSNWGLYVLLTWLPSYFKAFKETGIAAAGWYSAAPWVILFIIANLSGVIADRMVKRGMTITRVRKTMQVIGLLGSASLGTAGAGMFEPIHGSAPDIAGKDVANPAGAIASAAMLLDHLKLPSEARLLEQALEQTLREGHRTADLGGAVGCAAFGARVREVLDRAAAAPAPAHAQASL